MGLGPATTHGQLGLGDTANRSVPTKVGGGASWQAAYCGHPAPYAVTRPEGSLYAWGYNDFGQLGVGDKAEHLPPRAVAGTNWANVAPGPLDCVWPSRPTAPFGGGATT